mmetsp:Transcript_408/g.1156  ORF Transcript_408/g.1156 Transcript_408/m.1156 type:complete len:225 (+) Transcript_408:624-1298(+)
MHDASTGCTEADASACHKKWRWAYSCSIFHKWGRSSPSTAPCKRSSCRASSTAPFSSATACCSPATHSTIGVKRVMTALRSPASLSSRATRSSSYCFVCSVLGRRTPLPSLAPKEASKVVMTRLSSGSSRRASSSGVCPKTSSAFKSIPFTPSRKLTALMWRMEAATCKAVRPKASAVFTSQPFLTSLLTSSASLACVAEHNLKAQSAVPSTAPWRTSSSQTAV